MKDNIFSKDHIYGHILEFLYKNADKRYCFSTLAEQFKTIDPGYLKTCITWLRNDQLVEVENHEFRNINLDSGEYRNSEKEFYRISYTGFKFIHDLKSKKRTNLISIFAVIISGVALFVSVFKPEQKPYEIPDKFDIVFKNADKELLTPEEIASTTDTLELSIQQDSSKR